MMQKAMNVIPSKAGAGIQSVFKDFLMRFYKFFLIIFILLLSVFSSNSATAAVSQQEIEKIESAVPKKPAVKPEKPRKILVFSLCSSFQHTCIPYWEKALSIMGEKTDAFQTVISTDMSIFDANNLKQFDAVCLNNTTQLKFTPEQRENLLDFVRNGKGLIGIHAATDNFPDWPKAQEMMGGKFTGHPWAADGTWAVKIDEPNHPLMKAFTGKNFKINDEIYRTEPPLYSRSNQRVLMSLDMSDPNTKAKCEKPSDADTGISWIKKFGKGRIFYCSLGHNHHITWNPAVLQHVLDGIQFAVGDLKLDDKFVIPLETKSEKLSVSGELNTVMLSVAKHLANEDK